MYIYSKIVNSKSKYSRKEHIRIGQELKEHCLMFRFNERYLHLRKSYGKTKRPSNQ